MNNLENEKNYLISLADTYFQITKNIYFDKLKKEIKEISNFNEIESYNLLFDSFL